MLTLLHLFSAVALEPPTQVMVGPLEVSGEMDAALAQGLQRQLIADLSTAGLAVAETGKGTGSSTYLTLCSALVIGEVRLDCRIQLASDGKVLSATSQTGPEDALGKMSREIATILLMGIDQKPKFEGDAPDRAAILALGTKK